MSEKKLDLNQGLDGTCKIQPTDGLDFRGKTMKQNVTNQRIDKFSSQSEDRCDVREKGSASYVLHGIVNEWERK